MDYGTRGSHGDEGKDYRTDLHMRSAAITAEHFAPLGSKDKEWEATIARYVGVV